MPDTAVPAGDGIARGRIGPGTKLRVVDVMLTGTHEPGESRCQLLGAFAGARLLARITDGEGARLPHA